MEVEKIFEIEIVDSILGRIIPLIIMIIISIKLLTRTKISDILNPLGLLLMKILILSSQILLLICSCFSFFPSSILRHLQMIRSYSEIIIWNCTLIGYLIVLSTCVLSKILFMKVEDDDGKEHDMEMSSQHRRIRSLSDSSPRSFDALDQSEGTEGEQESEIHESSHRKRGNSADHEEDNKSKKVKTENHEIQIDRVLGVCVIILLFTISPLILCNKTTSFPFHLLFIIIFIIAFYSLAVIVKMENSISAFVFFANSILLFRLFTWSTESNATESSYNQLRMDASDILLSSTTYEFLKRSIIMLIREHSLTIFVFQSLPLIFFAREEVEIKKESKEHGRNKGFQHRHLEDIKNSEEEDWDGGRTFEEEVKVVSVRVFEIDKYNDTNHTNGIIDSYSNFDKVILAYLTILFYLFVMLLVAMFFLYSNRHTTHLLLHLFQFVFFAASLLFLLSIILLLSLFSYFIKK